MEFVGGLPSCYFDRRKKSQGLLAGNFSLCLGQDSVDVSIFLYKWTKILLYAAFINPCTVFKVFKRISFSDWLA